MEISIRTLVTLISGKWLCPDRDELWKTCNFITQSDLTNLSLYNRGILFAQSVLSEQYPEFIDFDCSEVVDVETCDQFVDYLEDTYGEYFTIEPADRLYMELNPIDEWALAKGISREEAEQSCVTFTPDREY